MAIGIPANEDPSYKPSPDRTTEPVAGKLPTPLSKKQTPEDELRRRALKKKMSPHQEHVLHVQHMANVKNNPKKYG
jgi:hypothetical protein